MSLAGIGSAHLAGAAGSGMQSLARVLIERGWRLSCSDVAPSSAPWFSSQGIAVRSSHEADCVRDDVDVLIHSAALGRDAPELICATAHGIPTLSYPRAVASLAEGRTLLAVAGTHGKSTTTAMAAEILRRAQLEATILCGAATRDGQPCAQAANGELMLVEACEYRRHFLNYRAHVAVILCVEHDHVDCFPDVSDVDAAFAAFARQVDPRGVLLVYAGCRRALAAAESAKCRVERLAVEADGDWQAVDLSAINGRYRFKLVHRSRPLGHVDLQVHGRHQVVNALAAAAVAAHAGANHSAIVHGLTQFGGLRRRLEPVFESRKVAFVDDFAHHPTEVSAAFSAVRQMYPARRVCAIFQPHQTSRTLRLLDEFASSLHNADWLAVAHVFGAREDRSPDHVAAATLADRVRRCGGSVCRAHDWPTIEEELSRILASGDVVLTMGAGDIRKLCDAVVDRFRRDS